MSSPKPTRGVTMSIDLLHEAITEAEAALAKVKSIAVGLFGQAETDATQVAETAVTSGLGAAETQAVGDAEQLAETAVADVKSAIPSTTSAPAPTATPPASTSTTTTPTAPVADVTTPPASAA